MSNKHSKKTTIAPRTKKHQPRSPSLTPQTDHEGDDEHNAEKDLSLFGCFDFKAHHEIAAQMDYIVEHRLPSCAKQTIVHPVYGHEIQTLTPLGIQILAALLPRDCKERIHLMDALAEKQKQFKEKLELLAEMKADELLRPPRIKMSAEAFDALRAWSVRKLVELRRKAAAASSRRNK